MNILTSNPPSIEQVTKNQFDTYLALPDHRGQRVHSLFVGLYLHTTKHWVAALETEPDLDFVHLVIEDFYHIYDDFVVQRQFHPLSEIPRHWRRYHWLARRLTMESPISAHLLLISLAARAHIRHDLGNAVHHAADRYRATTGRAVNFDKMMAKVIGPLSAQAFQRTALDYVASHRDQQRGWRKFVLTGYSWGLLAMRPIWVSSLESWRRKAWSEAVSQSELHPTARTKSLA